MLLGSSYDLDMVCGQMNPWGVVPLEGLGEMLLSPSARLTLDIERHLTQYSNGSTTALLCAAGHWD